MQDLEKYRYCADCGVVVAEVKNGTVIRRDKCRIHLGKYRCSKCIEAKEKNAWKDKLMSAKKMLGEVRAEFEELNEQVYDDLGAAMIYIDQALKGEK